LLVWSRMVADASVVDSPNGLMRSLERPDVTRLNNSCAALKGRPDASKPLTKSMNLEPGFSAGVKLKRMDTV
jgi:hypothetical protein